MATAILNVCFPAASGLKMAGSPKPASRLSCPGSIKLHQTRPVKAFLNVEDDPIFKEVLKEPIAFFGGVFAGLLRLDLNEEPLKEWVSRTAKAAAVVEADDSVLESNDQGPEEILIE